LPSTDSTIAVGTPTHEMDSVVHGSAFVFLRPATGWLNAGENQWVTGNVRSYFGHSVALSDDATTLVVGAPGKYSTDLPGEAQVFTRRSNPGAPDSYLLVAGLAPSDGHVMDLFGYAASIDGAGGTIVVGSPDHRTTGNVGGAYVYVRPINGWGTPNYTMTENAKLTASDAAINGGTLGIAVDISVDGNTIVAGMEGKSEGAPGPFAAYFFGKGAAGWSTSTESTKVIPWHMRRVARVGHALEPHDRSESNRVVPQQHGQRHVPAHLHGAFWYCGPNCHGECDGEMRRRLR
jgi:FG-GAP repeat